MMSAARWGVTRPAMSLRVMILAPRASMALAFSTKYSVVKIFSGSGSCTSMVSVFLMRPKNDFFSMVSVCVVGTYLGSTV